MRHISSNLKCRINYHTTWSVSLPGMKIFTFTNLQAKFSEIQSLYRVAFFSLVFPSERPVHLALTVKFSIHDLHLTQLNLFFFPYLFVLCFESSRTVWVLFPPVLCTASPFPQSGCWEVKRERADGVAFSKKCGITGASWWGDGERNCARCVDRVAVVGSMGRGVSSPGKKREGRGHLNYLCSPWPLSPSVSPWTDPLSERRGTFPQADAHPPPLFQIALAPSPVLPKLNCNNLPL